MMSPNDSSQTETTQIYVYVNPTTATVQSGKTTQLKANATLYSGAAITPAFAWSSADTSIATVSSTGLVTGKKAGSVKIAATARTVNGYSTVTVTSAIASLTLSPASITNLAIGATSTLTATAKDAAGATVSTPVTWTSSDTTIASVANGVVKGIKAGSATITAAAGGKTATASVSVAAAAQAVASVSLTPTSIPSLAVGANSTLTATAKDASGATVAATMAWTSSDTTVAKVAAGVVTGVKAGTAIITAAASGKSASANVTVAGGTTTPPTTPPPAPGNEVRATLPQVYLNTTMPAAPAAGGKIISVAAGGSLQNALNSALPGDVIELAAGATFTGSYTLPAKTGSSWIVIRPSNWQSLPAAGSRMTPTIAAQLNLPKIVVGGSTPALSAGNGSHHWRIVGIEVTMSGAQSYGLVSLDTPGATAVSQLPHDITLDRMYIHGTSTATLRRCVLLNSVASAVIDSHLSDCHEPSQDSQAISGYGGPGPFKIVNNYLEGATENIMFGGADPSIQGVTPSDIEIRRNHLFKPTSWKGVWRVKNLFEIKHAQRVLIEGNIMDGSWLNGQTGFGVVLKTVNQNGSCTWCVAQDLTFRYNIVRNVGAAFNLAASPDNSFQDIHARRFTIHDNVIQNINTGLYDGAGRGFQLLGDLQDMTIFHNTMIVPTHSALNFSGPVTARTTYRDNIVGGGSYGIIGDNQQVGKNSWNFYAPGGTLLGNVIPLPGSSANYPTGNNYPTSTAAIGFANLSGGDFHLTSSSAYKGKATDGRDPGADVDQVNTMTSGVIVP